MAQIAARMVGYASRCWYAMLVVFCSANSLQSQVTTKYVDYGYISADDNLCALIGWTSPQRERVKADYLELLQLQKAVRSDDIEGFQKLVANYNEKVTKTLNSQDVYDLVIRGLYLKKGCLFVFSQSVIDSIGISPQESQGISEYFKSRYELEMASTVSKIVLSQYTSKQEALDAAYAIINKTEQETLAHIREKHPGIHARIVKIESAIDKNKNYKEKNKDMLASVLFSLATRLQSKGMQLDRPPLSLTYSLVLLANLEATRKVIAFSVDELAFIQSKHADFVIFRNQVVDMYDSLRTNDSAKISSAHMFYRNMLLKHVRKDDDDLQKRHPECADRLRSLKVQLGGVYLIFNGSLPDAGAYEITPDQRGKFQTRLTALNRSNLSTSGNKNEQIAASMLRLNKDLYSNVLNDKQRAQWDKAIGKAISDNDYINIQAEFRKLNGE